MALLTFGTIVTGAWTAYKYWRVPYRLYLWCKAEEVEPVANQIWLEAGFSPKDSKWKVIESDEFRILLNSIPAKPGDDPAVLDLNWEDWVAMVKKSKLFCFDKNDTIHDQFWGEHSED